MYTPVILSGVLAVRRVGGILQPSRCTHRTSRRFVCNLVDARRLLLSCPRDRSASPEDGVCPMTNMIMGPPIFAPLLFGTSAYLGTDCVLPAARRCPPDSSRGAFAARQMAGLPACFPPCGSDLISAEQDIREGKFQRQIAVVDRHQRSAQRLRGVVLALQEQLSLQGAVDPGGHSLRCWPPLPSASVKSRSTPRPLFPRSPLACADAAVGFYYHARGVLRRPGGTKHLLYNIMYGPPIFAPLLFGQRPCWASSPVFCAGGQTMKPNVRPRSFPSSRDPATG